MASGDTGRRGLGTTASTATMVGKGIRDHLPAHGDPEGCAFKKRKLEHPPAPALSAEMEIDDDDSCLLSCPPSIPSQLPQRAQEALLPLPPPSLEYEVFLSFSAADVGAGLADYIYHDLVDAGIRVFRVSNVVPVGGQLDPELRRAIERCKISIPILSKNYAASEWRLQELALMMECRCHGNQTVLPIFVDLSADEFQNQFRSCAESSSQHLNLHKWKPGIIQQWRHALAEICQREGLDLVKDADGLDGRMTKLVVTMVIGELRPHLLLDSVALDDHVEAIMALLNLDENDVRTIGIYGVGGIGKTFLALATYNQVFHRFEGSSFLSDIRKMLHWHGGLSYVQSRLLCDILGIRHERNVHGAEVRNMLKRALKDKKVLIILDGVDDFYLLRVVAPELHWLAPGSRIIVTTQDRDVLNGFERLYEVREMHLHNALLLLCKYAFGQDSPPVEFASISWDMLMATGGHPLSIVVTGSDLAGGSKAEWEAMMMELKRVPNADIQNIFKISYNKLDLEEQMIFLDIACCLVGMDARFAVHMWHDSQLFPEYGFQNILRTSLIKIGDDCKLWMPYQVRELGREIVHQESQRTGNRSRLWGEDALDVIKRNEGTRNVEAICFSYGTGSTEPFISNSELETLLNLRFLELGDANLCGDSRELLPNLRWLGWHGLSELNIPSRLYLKNLIILDQSKSAVDENWDEWRYMKAVMLKVLNLTSCHQLARTPPFSSFPCIEMLILQDCSGLRIIDPSIRYLKYLKVLDLRNCRNLEKLPDDIGFLVELEELLIDECPIREIPISEGMKKLCSLSAKSCRLLAQIPDSCGFLVALEKLVLDDCESLTELPISIGQLDSLKFLSLCHTGVEYLPDSIGNLSNLKVLKIDHCPMRSLPCSLWKLEILEILSASGCWNLSGDIPFELINLSFLRILRLDHTSITSLPPTIIGLCHLHTLDLEGCMNLRTIPALPPNLIVLKVTPKISTAVSDLTYSINSQQLEILNCSIGQVQIQGRYEKPSSSSSVSTQSGYKYDVFLSFSEADSGTQFTDSLYCSLIDAGIRTFRCDGELRLSEETSLELSEAIQESRVSIPIFSKGYASSKWCLKNVAKMVECMVTRKQKILPIFYDVAPDEVRHQTGASAKAFSLHVQSKNYDPKMVNEWRDALAKVGALRGWFTDNNRCQEKVIKEVVFVVLKLLKKLYLDVSGNLVGIQDHMEEVMKLLEIDADDVKAVSICGMGGIGKTTIAELIYNQLQDKFECCSFLKDIREASLIYGLESLHGQLVSDIFKCEYRKSPDIDTGKAVLKPILRMKKVLILLDNVDQYQQLNYLVGDCSCFGKGSRIIVTARKVDDVCKSNIFINGPKENVLIYEVKEMHPHYAFFLFCKHAFRQDLPLPDLASLSWEIVKATGRIPLVVMAIGSYLSFHKDRSVWEEALVSMRTGNDVLDILKISFEALNCEQRKIFLDIACLFIGMDYRFPLHVWKACGFSPETAIEDLVLRSFIQIGENNELLMPDLYKELGRKIARDESNHDLGKQSRLWCSKDIIQVLQNGKGPENVEAIRFDYGIGSVRQSIRNDELDSLPNLQFLELAGANLQGDPRGVLPNLRWLGWHGSTKLNLPSRTYPKNLIILDLSKSAVNENWDGWSSYMETVKLRVLNLTSCQQLLRTPQFSLFPCMERLILKDCSSLAIIDPSIGLLKYLKFLDLRKCWNLEKLPDEIGFLEKLEELFIDECPIREIPISPGMTKLRILSAKSCKLLARMPQSIGFLVAVEELVLDDCESLTELPISIGQLNSLKVLRLSHTRVVCLPDSVGNLSKLKMLNIDNCPLRSLPCSLGKLETLEVLNASRCLNLSGEIPFELKKLKLLRILRLDHTNITSIPASIIELSHLQTLDTAGCMKLLTLPELPSSLVNLKVTRTALETVPNRRDLINLRQLEILSCSTHQVQIQGKSEKPSSSPSVPIQPGYEYEVFLSFRGPETRTGFTDSLYYSLVDAGIRTFKDNEDLCLGEEISSKLREAIEQSRISIPIFSKGYASSKWCLKEVAKMVECMSTKKQKVLPIFYDVAPDEVRHQTGAYAEALSMHMNSKNFSNEMVKEWRDALAKVGTLRGWDLTNNRYQGKVIREVVSEVLRQLKKPYLDVTENLVGIEDHVEEVMKKLEINSDDVKVVGICGMGGIGKTTIAKFIFNLLQDQFEYCSFLKDIREASLLSKGLESLQLQLVSDVLRRKYEKFPNVDVGKAVLKGSLRNKKVLILLDDVDQIEQLNNLVGDLCWFGRGSRIIITARKVDILCMSNVFTTAPEENASTYVVKEMHQHNAFLLFCKHAFRQDLPLPDLANLSWKIVEATGRLPLAIVTIGSYLSFQNKKGVWKEALRSLKTRTEILDKLKISYEALSREQREIFLDIVCLFIGMGSKTPLHVWKARGFSPETTIEDLVLRSLIRIGENNELVMHDLYKELGREIIRQESNGDVGKQSRLWCAEDAIWVLQNEKGTKNVKAIHLDQGIQSETYCFTSAKFEKLLNVWFLELGSANLHGNFQGHLTDLRWLSHHGHDLLNIPHGLNLRNLVVLDLSRSNVSENWSGWDSLTGTQQLEVLNLSSCHELKCTPNFPSLPRMKRLILEDCRGLAAVGPSIIKLEALEFLDMRNCPSLVQLPEEIGSLVALTELLLDDTSIREVPISRNMENLEILSVRSCKSLSQLPWSVDLPLKLTKLFLDNCESLTVIPDSIGQLPSLTDLSLSHTSTIILPESIGKLFNLETLNIDHCPMRHLPRSIWRLEKLEVITASGCLNLDEEIPSDLGNLTSLRILGLDRTNVRRIPSSIGRLHNLHTLDLKECKQIRRLPNLPSSLVNLKVTCMSSATVPNLSDLVHLKELEIWLCGKNAKVWTEDIKKFSKIEKFAVTII